MFQSDFGHTADHLDATSPSIGHYVPQLNSTSLGLCEKSEGFSLADEALRSSA
jgi:hypothetical protein